MELVTHGTDAAAGDGLPAPAAQSSAALVVMQLTEGTSVQFKEGTSRKTAEAVLGRGGQGEEKEKGHRCQEAEPQRSETRSLEIPASYLADGGENTARLQNSRANAHRGRCVLCLLYLHIKSSL